MTAAIFRRGRMQGATLASIAIHLAVAVAIPALAWTAASNTQIETVSFTRVIHIQIFRPRTVARHSRATAPHRSAAPALNFAHDISLRRLPRENRSPHVALATNVPAAPVIAEDVRSGDSSSGSDAAPTVSSSPSALAAANARQNGGYLPFGAEQLTPVLDPAVRKQLDSLGAHVTLIVTVGDDGRTTNVRFEPPIDPQLENRIRSLLADASWDPAVCGGGVSCEGQATIKI